MEQSNVSERLISTLNEISKNEVNEISLLIAIIKRNIIDLINKNIEQINDEFMEKCEYYGKSISDVNSEKIEILNSYREEFNKIATKLEEEYINLALEIQEAQAKQKIIIADLKKTIDLKEKYISSNDYSKHETSIETLNKKIDILAEKYIKYCGFEDACIVKLSECNERIESAIDSVMQYETGKQLIVAEKKNVFSIFKKIFKVFAGEKRFEREYLDKKKKTIEKIKNNTASKLQDIDKGINDTIIILEAYNSKINKVYN